MLYTRGLWLTLPDKFDASFTLVLGLGLDVQYYSISLSFGTIHWLFNINSSCLNAQLSFLRFRQNIFLACFSRILAELDRKKMWRRKRKGRKKKIWFEGKVYSGDLNSRNIWIANFYLFVIQMVHFSDDRYHGTKYLNNSPLTKWWSIFLQVS